jgi:DNA repair photolyase
MNPPLPASIAPRGRGVPDNPTGRFEELEYTPDPEALEDLRRDAETSGEPFRLPSPATVCFKDDSQSIIAHNDSPDVGANVSLNPYRGCEHGCSYCYARPYHEFLGFSAGLDFETKIMVKPAAPRLLRKALSSPSWKPQHLACSGVTDCYQPLERKFRLTRACLEVLAEFRQPVGIVTKNRLVTRDIDLLQTLAHHGAVCVTLSLTTLDPHLSAIMEPRASAPSARLAAIRQLSEAGIAVGVSLAPVIPGLNDHEIPAILTAAREHGASYAFYSVVRLPYRLPDLFFSWLERHFPEKREKVEHGIRALRSGELNDSRFGIRMAGKGTLAATLSHLFEVTAARVGLGGPPDLSTAAFQRPGEQQLLLF